jgi:hypothetical protein
MKCSSGLKKGEIDASEDASEGLRKRRPRAKLRLFRQLGCLLGRNQKQLYETLK